MVINTFCSSRKREILEKHFSTFAGTMKKFLFAVLAFSALCFAQQEQVAIIQTMDDRDSIGISDLAYLTDRLRETAVKVLPKQRYGVMTSESIVAFLGSQERAAKVCNEASCLAEIGRKVSADYVAQARIGRFGKNLTIKTELYSSKSGNLIGSFTGNSKDIYGLLAIIDKNASDLFKEMLGASGDSKATQKPSNDILERGILFLERGDYDMAIEDFTEALRLQPNYAFAYNSRGGAYLSKGDYDKAIVDFNQAIKLNPNDAGAYGGRGLAYYNKRDHNKAIADLNQTIKLDSSVFFAYKFRGFAYYYKGDYDKAIADLSQAIKLNPNDKEARQSLEEIQREIAKEGKFLTDSRDGKKYRTVAIGKQIWMAENLNYNASGSKCCENLESNCRKYGRLYDWNTAKFACPEGWRLPSSSEWNILENFVGGYKIAGKKLKTANTSEWLSNGNGTDDYGFSALPGGGGFPDGSFVAPGIGGFYWSASEDYRDNSGRVYSRVIDSYKDGVGEYGYDKDYLFSVRCLKDE